MCGLRVVRRGGVRRCFLVLEPPDADTGIRDNSTPAVEAVASGQLERCDRNRVGDVEVEHLVLEHENAVTRSAEARRGKREKQMFRKTRFDAAAEHGTGRFSQDGLEALCRREHGEADTAVNLFTL